MHIFTFNKEESKFFLNLEKFSDPNCLDVNQFFNFLMFIKIKLI
jgi:hypothetical protein